MASFEIHCSVSLEKFGNEWTELHLWLDAFANTPQYGMRHRSVRHHEAGIREAVELFGVEAELPERLHVEMDLAEEGWCAGIDRFPRDQIDYKRIGFY